MKRTLIRAIWAGSLLTILLAAAAFGNADPGNTYASATSSVFAEPGPTPTYISELAPAVAIAPRQPAALPRSGVGVDPIVPWWPTATGVALALLGCVLIYTALAQRPEPDGWPLSFRFLCCRYSS